MISSAADIESKQNQKFAGKINTEPLLLLPSLCHDLPI